MEEMTAEGKVLRLEGENKEGKCFSCGEVGHMAGACPRNAWRSTEKWIRENKVLRYRDG